MPMSVLFVVSGGTGSRTVRSTASGLSHFVFLFALSACAVLLQGVLGYAGTIAVQSAPPMALAPKVSRGDATVEMMHPQDPTLLKPDFLPPCGGHELLPSSCFWGWNSSILTMASRPFFSSRFLSKATSFMSSLIMIHMTKSKCLLFLVATNLPACSAGFTCMECRDTIDGCPGGANCPLILGMAGNANIFKTQAVEKTPSLSNLIVPEAAAAFTRTIVDAIVGLACAPAVGTTLDLAAKAGGSYVKTGAAIVKAAMYSHCSCPEAVAEINRRIEEATEQITITKLVANLEALRMSGDQVLSALQGVYQLVWAKCSMIISTRSNGVHRIEVGSTSRTTSITATLVRPTSEFQYFELMHFFMMVVIALGLSSAVLMFQFLDDVAYGAIRMGESWQTSFELMLLYLRKVDRDVSGTLHIGNVFRHGGQDTMLAEARRNAAAFFRTLGGTPRPELATTEQRVTTATGKSNPNATKACKDFNGGRKCTRLDTKGNCVFAHKCDQFVSNKGPRGVCFGEHARCNGCNYDDAFKVNKPASA